MGNKTSKNGNDNVNNRNYSNSNSTPISQYQHTYDSQPQRSTETDTNSSQSQSWKHEESNVPVKGLHFDYQYKELFFLPGIYDSKLYFNTNTEKQISDECWKKSLPLSSINLSHNQVGLGFDD